MAWMLSMSPYRRAHRVCRLASKSAGVISLNSSSTRTFSSNRLSLLDCSSIPSALKATLHVSKNSIVYRLKIQVLPHRPEFDVVVQCFVSDVNGLPRCQHTIDDPGRLPSEVRNVNPAFRKGFVQANDEIEKTVLLLHVNGHVHVTHRRLTPRRHGPMKHRKRDGRLIKNFPEPIKEFLLVHRHEKEHPNGRKRRVEGKSFLKKTFPRIGPIGSDLSSPHHTRTPAQVLFHLDVRQALATQ